MGRVVSRVPPLRKLKKTCWGRVRRGGFEAGVLNRASQAMRKHVHGARVRRSSCLLPRPTRQPCPLPLHHITRLGAGACVPSA